VLDVFVTHVCLDGACVGAGSGELEALSAAAKNRVNMVD